MSTNVPNLKQIGGGHRKNGKKFVDLMWNDPSELTCHSDNNHWADIYKLRVLNRLGRFIYDFLLVDDLPPQLVPG